MSSLRVLCLEKTNLPEKRNPKGWKFNIDLKDFGTGLSILNLTRPMREELNDVKG